MNTKSLCAEYPFFSEPSARVTVKESALVAQLAMQPDGHHHLTNHFVDGRCVLVANALLELLAESAACLFEHTHDTRPLVVGFEDVKLERYLACDRHEPLQLCAAARQQAPVTNDTTLVRVELLCDVRKHGRVVRTNVRHASGLVALRREPLRPMHFEAPPLPLRKVSVAAERFYPELMPSRRPLFHVLGGTFQVSSDQDILCGSLRATDRTEELIAGASGALLTGPILHDGALQAQALHAKLTHQSARVPLALHGVRIYQTVVPGQSYEVFVERRREDSQHTWSDIRIVDSERRLVASYARSLLTRKYDLDAAEVVRQASLLVPAGLDWPQWTRAMDASGLATKASPL